MVFTSDALKPPTGPAAGAIKSPSGGCPALLAGATRYAPLPAAGPADTPAGRVLAITKGSVTPPMETAPGAAGVGPKESVALGLCVVDPMNAANSATSRSLELVTTPIPPTTTF